MAQHTSLVSITFEAENLNLYNADLIVLQAIDYGYQVPAVCWSRSLETEKAGKRSHIPLLLPTALTSPLVRFWCN